MGVVGFLVCLLVGGSLAADYSSVGHESYPGEYYGSGVQERSFQCSPAHHIQIQSKNPLPAFLCKFGQEVFVLASSDLIRHKDTSFEIKVHSTRDIGSSSIVYQPMSLVVDKVMPKGRAHGTTSASSFNYQQSYNDFGYPGYGTGYPHRPTYPGMGGLGGGVGGGLGVGVGVGVGVGGGSGGGFGGGLGVGSGAGGGFGR